MRIYLDNCCYNRPFDDQSRNRIKLESEAKLYVQEMVMLEQVELCWSYILDYENDANPLEARKEVIQRWKDRAVCDIVESPKLLEKAKALQDLGVKPKDALHVACAVAGECEYFLTTDDELLRKLDDLDDINVIDPATFIVRIG